MALRRAILSSLAVLAGIGVSILWIDRPLAQALAEFGFGHAAFSGRLVRLPVMIALAYGGVALGAAFLILGRRLPRWAEAAMLAGIALLVALWLTHDLLKPLFGRTVPNLYLQSGRYAFLWFHRGSDYGSFPSGHATQAAALLAVVWAFYPRWRWVCGGAMAVLAAALMLGRWHYLSDVLAGGMVGAAVAGAVMVLWRLLCKHWAVARS